jgi:hypothetical protein
MTKQERQARYRERRRVRLASPSAVALAASDAPAEQLDNFTLAIRQRLTGYLDDLGGKEGLADTKVEQVKGLVDVEIVLEPLTRDIHLLARSGQLWSMNTRKASALLSDWIRLREHHDRLLIAVGLDLADRPDPSGTLAAITAEIIANRKPQEPAVLPDAQPKGELDPRGKAVAGHAAGSPVAEPITVTPLTLAPEITF